MYDGYGSRISSTLLAMDFFIDKISFKSGVTSHLNLRAQNIKLLFKL